MLKWSIFLILWSILYQNGRYFITIFQFNFTYLHLSQIKEQQSSTYVVSTIKVFHHNNNNRVTIFQIFRLIFCYFCFRSIFIKTPVAALYKSLVPPDPTHPHLGKKSQIKQILVFWISSRVSHDLVCRSRLWSEHICI